MEIISDWLWEWVVDLIVFEVYKFIHAIIISIQHAQQKGYKDKVERKNKKGSLL